MPLPSSDVVSAWPPAPMQPLFARMGQWSALYAGDLAQLQAAFGGGASGDQTGFFASDRGGFKANVGRTLQRFFLGEPTRGSQRNTKIHVPIAAEICQASADLLFADPITVTVGRQDGAAPKNPTEQRLAVLLDDRFHSTLAEAAELAAALGGAYLRVTWDPTNVPGRPFSTVVDADNALPEFSFGRLTAVTFWWVVRTEGEHVWRHLERHETVNGRGVILHGLYQGTNDKLGFRVGLEEVASTASLALATDLNLPGTIDTKSPGLAVQYLPNQTPNRGWRSHPVGRYLGRSDLDGIEHLIDQLAEVMSAWTRAIRLAKARLFIAKSLTQSGGPGNGVLANLEQEAYVTVDKLGGGGPNGGSPALADQMQLVQAKVEYEQYAATAQALLEQILQAAGYSTQTFGIDHGGARGGTRTATEVESKERRSLMTRDRKIREVKPPVADHIVKLLAVDNDLFQASGKQANVLTGIDIVFADGVQQTQLALAQTVLALYQAESASLATRVGILNPAWDDDKVQEEVARIEAEFPQAPALLDVGGGYPPMPGDPPAPTE